MWWAAAADWSAKAVDQFLSYDSAKKANKTNIKLARENRDFIRDMSNTALQRHMSDAEAAGINPFYAIGQGASTPATQAARVEPEYQPSMAAGRPSETMLQVATARKLNAEADMVEAQVPFAAGNARVQAANLDTQRNLLLEELYQARNQSDVGDLERFKSEQLNQVLIELQKLELRAMQLGMPALENAFGAESTWYGKYIKPYLPDLLKSGQAITSGYRDVTKPTIIYRGR